MSIIPLSFAPEYFVSDDGYIYKLVGGRSQRVKQDITNGYAVVKIHNKKYFVHKLVAEYFVGGRSDKKCRVIHLNFDNLDNNAENLMWVTPSEAQLYSQYTVEKRTKLNFH
jgi:hypothetical protein